MLAWPAVSNANRYPETLYSYLSESEVEDFRPGWRAIPRAFQQRYDIFHIHWLERAFWRTGRMATLRSVIVTLIVASILKLRGGRLIWTAHDPIPHDIQANAFLRQRWGKALWWIYSTLLASMMDGVILLSVTHQQIVLDRFPALKNTPFTIIPHPHYKGVYPNNIKKPEARKNLDLEQDVRIILLLGSLRPYKSVDGLIKSFRNTSDSTILLIAGQPDGKEYSDYLQDLSKGDTRIRLHFGFVADDELQLFLNAADVAVIPFQKATNSGSVALALSFGKPVAVPDIPVFKELREIVSDKWMYLFQGEIDAEKIENIMKWVGEDRSIEPPLDALDWQAIATKTAAFFKLTRHSESSR